jgi:hypothetical protein
LARFQPASSSSISSSLPDQRRRPGAQGFEPTEDPALAQYPPGSLELEKASKDCGHPATARRSSNYQPRIAQPDPASCICRKSTGGFFLQVE